MDHNKIFCYLNLVASLINHLCISFFQFIFIEKGRFNDKKSVVTVNHRCHSKEVRYSHHLLPVVPTVQDDGGMLSGLWWGADPGVRRVRPHYGHLAPAGGGTNAGKTPPSENGLFLLPL